MKKILVSLFSRMAIAFAIAILIGGCSNNKTPLPSTTVSVKSVASPQKIIYPSKTIHVFVALCDNKYQGIVPVSQKVGNGQDPVNNLYWGWGYGVKTHFSKSNHWTLVRKQQGTYPILERLLFKHKSSGFYMVADAYDGRTMKECIDTYMKSAAGITADTLMNGRDTIGINGNAKMTAFVGHNGLMDFSLENNYTNADGRARDCIILACFSKNYFSPFLKTAKANPVLWTTNLMGPEAYTLHDALDAYIKGANKETIQEKAATVYANYTKCSVKAAKKLLVTGW